MLGHGQDLSFQVLGKRVLSATFQEVLEEVLVRVTIFLPHHKSQKDTFGTLAQTAVVAVCVQRGHQSS